MDDDLILEDLQYLQVSELEETGLCGWTCTWTGDNPTVLD